MQRKSICLNVLLFESHDRTKIPGSTFVLPGFHLVIYFRWVFRNSAAWG